MNITNSCKINILRGRKQACKLYQYKKYLFLYIHTYTDISGHKYLHIIKCTVS